MGSCPAERSIFGGVPCCLLCVPEHSTRRRGGTVGVVDEVHRGGPGSHHRPLTVRRLIALFVLAGMVALSTAVSVTAWASRRSGLTQATREARQTTWLIAVGIVEPAITPGVLQRDAVALNALHELVSARVLNDSLLRVKIWAADGTVLYSNDSRLIGEQFSFDEAELAILRDGGTNAGISDMRAPENGLEDTSVPQLEVYTRINGPDGEPLLFEAYFKSSTVQLAARRAWRTYAPISLSALVALQLAQVPVVWHLARRLRREQADRELLLRQAIEASGNERRRIAADLHDGVVQNLSGVAFTLSAVGRSLDLPPRLQPQVTEAAEHIRASVQGMRSLLVDLYPPNLTDEGLESALGSLVARLSGHGLTTSLQVELSTPALSDEVTALLYRSAQEALRNVTKHASARNVTVSVRQDPRRAVLTVEDDGVGFDPSGLLESRSDGHVGMRVLADLISECGGDVFVESDWGSGTRVIIEVPT